jgi:hypothetical protein
VNPLLTIGAGVATVLALYWMLRKREITFIVLAIVATMIACIVVSIVAMATGYAHAPDLLARCAGNHDEITVIAHVPQNQLDLGKLVTVRIDGIIVSETVVPWTPTTFNVANAPTHAVELSYHWTGNVEPFGPPSIATTDQTVCTSTGSPPVVDTQVVVPPTTVSTGEQTTTTESAPTTLPASATTTPVPTTAAPSTVAGPGTTALSVTALTLPPTGPSPYAGEILLIASLAGAAGMALLIVRRRPRVA